MTRERGAVRAGHGFVGANSPALSDAAFRFFDEKLKGVRAPSASPAADQQPAPIN